MSGAAERRCPTTRPPAAAWAQESAGDGARLVRVMPNTPCLVGETAAAMCLGGRADDGDAELVRTLFEAVGRIYRCAVAAVGVGMACVFPGMGQAGVGVGRRLARPPPPATVA